MQSSLYVSLSAQLALEQRLNTVATNVANLGTAGYRAEEVKFGTILSQAGKREVAFATPGDTFLSRRGGPLTKTDSPLDVGLNGDGWLAVRGGQGTVYTRDGRMQISAAGDLQDLSGRPILDPGGSPLTVDPEGPPITIGLDGIITQGVNQIGALGVFRLDPAATLTRVNGGAVASDRPGVPILDFNQRGETTVRVQQGFQEGANVNPVMEMARLIELTRTFQSAAAAVSESESSLQDAIRGLVGSAA
ncbi:flagellar basal-body rod protein FlgF [Methylobacterium sp. SI9]|uniref:flagellar basal-body rod protein FlgF n=1 Tax=Methylobacterium guangdongense TaxID=3138811 RepID=UPI00313B33B4